MSERERLARLLYSIAGVGAPWGTGNLAPHDVRNAYSVADTLLLAGFGDKAEAWGKGFESAAEGGWRPGELGADENPYN